MESTTVILGHDFLMVGDEPYDLAQFHLHTPSEHTVDHKEFDLEIHFVHKARTEDKFFVIGVLCTASDNPPKGEQIFFSHVSQSEPSQTAAASFHTQNLFGDLELSKYYLYQGSFTTPPCTEGVQWLIIADECKVPPSFLETLAKYPTMNRNFRPVQPKNMRRVDIGIELYATHRNKSSHNHKVYLVICCILFGFLITSIFLKLDILSTYCHKHDPFDEILTRKTMLDL